MSKQTDDAVVTPETYSDSINQIREIILGEQINSWEKNFKRLEEKLNDLERKISSVQETGQNENRNLGNEISLSKEDFSAKITGIQKEFNKKIKELERVKVDKDSIGEVFIQWGQQVKTKTK